MRVCLLTATAVIVASILVATATRIILFRQGLSVSSLASFPKLQQVSAATQGAPLLINVDDMLASQWAVYFLRSEPIRVTTYRGYLAMAHIVPLLEKARSPRPDEARYVLTDARAADAHDPVWRSGPYALYRVAAGGAISLTAIANPNGAETFEGLPFYWIGPAETVLSVTATQGGEMVLAARFIAGPSLPGRDRRLEVRVGDASRTVVLTHDAVQTVVIPVQAGQNLCGSAPSTPQP